jgi:hypothetical protein
MLSSVPITIGGEKHTLQFLGGDVVEIEDDYNRPISDILIDQNGMRRVGILAKFLYYGLKKGTDARGNPIRELPQNAEGLATAQDLIRQYTSGKPASALMEIRDTIYQAFGACEWFNIKTVVAEAVASVPQVVEPSKKSEGPGSSGTSQ